MRPCRIRKSTPLPFVLPVISLAAAPFELAENGVFQYPPGIGGKFDGYRDSHGMINVAELGRVERLLLRGIVEEVHRNSQKFYSLGQGYLALGRYGEAKESSSRRSFNFFPGVPVATMHLVKRT
jgi:hypothetical protein